jgi:outer membrane protein TolC
MFTKSRPYFFTLIFILYPSFALSTPLAIENYLDQVAKDSPARQANLDLIEGSKMTIKDGDSVYVPTLTSQFSQLNDSKEPTSPFMGNKTHATSFSTGIQKQWDFGLSSKLSYTLSSVEQLGLPSNLFPGGALRYTTGLTQLELSQSLWRNFLGSEFKATSEIAEASSMAVHHAERFKQKMLIAQAESAYYRLALAREAIKIQKDLVERARQILDWASKRVRNQLADRADMLQAKAAYQSREIDYKNQMNEERSAALTFNTLRNLQNETVADELQSVSISDVMSLKAPKKADLPADLAAAEQNERIQAAQNELAKQKTLPDVSLFGNIGLNGVDSFKNPAIRESFNTNTPTYLVGIKLSMPLTVFDASDIRAGRERQRLAAESNVRQKRLESLQNWEDLNQKFTESLERLKLIEALATAQKEKLDHEKYRLQVGRTTTYQVLLFEQDFAQAVLAKIRTETEILSLHSQLKTYAD